MTPPTTRNRPSTQIPVRDLTVWYHLPFSIESGNRDMEMCGWTKATRAATPDQEKYFHSFVTRALFSDARNRPRIEHWERADLCPDLDKDPDKSRKHVFVDMQADREDQGVPTVHTFRARIEDVSLRMHRPDAAMSQQNPGMGILVIGLTFYEVSTEAPKECMAKDLPGARQLTLADAQNVLDWSRRAFARWTKSIGPEGAKTAIPGDMISRLRVLDHVDNGKWQAVCGLFSVAPWVRCMLKPWRAEEDAVFFGDERAFITSAIMLDEAKESDGRAQVLSVSTADLFRLAEADPARDCAPYQKPFIEETLKTYRYDRHAPAPDGQTGNASIILLAHHHQCLLGAGEFMDKNLVEHTTQYYRHMQFLCVHEAFRLVQFSQRLTWIVENEPDPDLDFPTALASLRKDFLNFTHLHHFSNVSLQLQPREMFAQLYSAMELGDRFREVEEEMKVATEFQQAREAADAAARAERLNDLLAFGVPLSLIAGLTGANLFIGENHPLAGDKEGPLEWTTQFLHLAGVVSVVSLVWAMACFLIAKRAGSSPQGARHLRRKYSHLGWIWGMVGVAFGFVATLMGSWSWLESLVGP